MTVKQAEEARLNEDGKPKFLVLLDNKTVLERVKKQSILLHNKNDEFARKCLFKVWKSEEEIDHFDEVTQENMVTVFPKLDPRMKKDNNEEVGEFMGHEDDYED